MTAGEYCGMGEYWLTGRSGAAGRKGSAPDCRSFDPGRKALARVWILRRGPARRIAAVFLWDSAEGAIGLLPASALWLAV